MTIPDAGERRRALDPRGSFIVQAPAGSGKTELLIQRTLTLLAVVDRPEAVVAITFTKKAAGEMRLRVLRALRDSAGPRPAREHEAQTWELARAVRQRSDALGWDLFRNPGRLRIRTIDSLCASFTRQMPWVSRLGAPPRIVDDAGPLYAEAARRTIELLEAEGWSDAVEALLEHLDNNFQVLQGLLADMLKRRDQWLRHVARRGAQAEIRADLEAAVRNLVRDTIERTRGLVPAGLDGEIAWITAAAGQNLITAERDGKATLCAGLTELRGADSLDAWIGIVDTFLKKDGDWRRCVTVANGFPPAQKDLKAHYRDLVERLARHEPLRQALEELRHLPDGQCSETRWQALCALVKLLPMAVAQLKVRFRQGGEADYAEVAMAAQTALGEGDEPTDLALGLDCRVQHLLLDEFQDTSVSQFELLEKLTAGWERDDGRTIFAVGDPMQSIYRFREAEVGLFLKACREGIGQVPLEMLRLTANFRSDAGIVAWVNETFPSVLPADDDITTGAISFCASEAVKAEGPAPAVRIHPFLERDDAAEAERVVELVRAAQERKAGKVAILVRARSHLQSILPALHAAGLRFRAVEIDSLAELPLVRDLTALTRALLHPADRIAWLAVLRAPWCGLTLADLHALAGTDIHAAVWDLMADEARLAALSEDGRERLARVRAVLQRAIGTRPHSLRASVEGAWLALGGPACVADQGELDDARAFFDLLEEAEDGASLDVAAFTDRIDGLYAKADPEAGEALQIMSIHKAKGLEFDVVILPGLGRSARGDESRLMLWLERPRLGAHPDLLLALIHGAGADSDATYDYLKLIDARKSEHEAGRVLYVAATRAKSELHLLGHAAVHEKDDVIEIKPAANSLLAKMWNAAAPVFQEALAGLAPSDEVAAETERAPRAIERLSREWRLPAPPRSVAAVQEAALPDAVGVSFHWVGDTLRHVGTVVHQMLRRMAVDGLSQWDAARVRQHRDAYRAALTALGVPAAEVTDAVYKVAGALIRTLADPRGQWLLSGDHEAAACEYPVTGIVGGELITGRVDRTFIDREGTRWIVDYKTSSHEGGGLDAFLDNERERYGKQLERYRCLFAALEDRPVRAGLYFPLLGGWREATQAEIQPPPSTRSSA